MLAKHGPWRQKYGEDCFKMTTLGYIGFVGNFYLTAYQQNTIYLVTSGHACRDPKMD